jgi:transcriptional regulator of acetoin/glycerol metabolism
MASTTPQRPPSTTGDHARINRAWDRLPTGAPSHDVRRVIHQSWERSNSAGVDPSRGRAPALDDRDEIERMRAANEALCRAARGSLAKIGRMLQGAEAMMILTDGRGLVIEAIGDPDTLEAGRKINLRVGALWCERAVGTNGIGTALHAGEPMFVHGSEHFVENLKEWSCAAAPVRDPIDQAVIGAVDLSGLTRIFREHNTAFAAAAAGEIEAALAHGLNERRIRLLDALLEQGPRLGREDGVLILDRMGRILHRSGFERLILQDGRELDVRAGRRLLELTGEMDEAALAAALPPDLGCRGVATLSIDGAVDGVAIVVDCARKPARPAPALGSATRRTLPGATIIADSPAMLEAIDLARRVARVNAPVLIQGETGTGKELFARLIHAEFSGPRETPFVAINCGAISRELFGGELFGHVEGGFTGATREGKPGKLELANGGVFCLDEIGEMPLEIQPYLLRVLEERVIHRIGDSRARPFDARLVALTNRDLRTEAESGRFRSDLYYRIGAVTVHVPPLRERGDDILLLIEHFNRRIAAEYGVDPLLIAAPVADALLRHAWPGNVRELRNLMQRLHSLSRDRRVSMSDLPPELLNEAQPRKPKAEAATLKDAEKTIILRALTEHNGNLTRVAEALGVTRPTLYRKLARYGVHRGFA